MWPTKDDPWANSETDLKGNLKTNWLLHLQLHGYTYRNKSSKAINAKKIDIELEKKNKNRKDLPFQAICERESQASSWMLQQTRTHLPTQCQNKILDCQNIFMFSHDCTFDSQNER